MIFTSSTAVYGQADGSWIDEASVTEPTEFSGQILLAQAPFEGDAPRLPGIYGPRRTRRVRAVEEGEARAQPPGHPPRYGNGTTATTAAAPSGTC